MIQRISIGAMLVTLTASTSFGQTITETFDAGIPASWTIHDNFPVVGSPDFSAVPWTVNTAEGMENYTNGTPSLAATASSHNHPGQYDISLITPTFVLNAGPDGQSVRYDINFQRVDVFESFDTNLSINGGDWITMTHDESSLGPAYSTGPPLITRGIDLTFYGAAVTDSARVEFRYYSTDLLPMVQQRIRADRQRSNSDARARARQQCACRRRSNAPDRRSPDQENAPRAANGIARRDLRVRSVRHELCAFRGRNARIGSRLRGSLARAIRLSQAAAMPELILHHYELSPYAEKIRLALGRKGLAWRSVQTPMVMPKPDHVELTGGYRRVPVLQIGADIYCDTHCIARVLDRALAGSAAVAAGARDAASTPLSRWAETTFLMAILAFFGIGGVFPDEFVEDRRKTMVPPGTDLDRVA